MKVTAALIPLQGRLFVGQRPPWKKFGLLWEFPGGKVEPGESLEQSLIREIKEELCLDIIVRDLFKKIRQEESDFEIDLHAYWCEVQGGRLCLSEHVAFMWANLSELRGINLTRADRLLIPFLESVPEFPEFSMDWGYVV
jgi:mutator protein MutT